MNSATINIIVYFAWYIEIFIYVGFIPRIKIPGSLGMLIFNFSRYYLTVSKVVAPIHIVDALQ